MKPRIINLAKKEYSITPEAVTVKGQYNPEFTEKVKRAEQQIRSGKYSIIIKAENAPDKPEHFNLLNIST